MQRALAQDLARVRGDLLDMAGRVEAMIAEANRALVERDPKVAEAVIDADHGVDRLEKEIDERCLVALALQEPKAVDFRFLVAVQKIVGDLERMGDCAVNMAQAAQHLALEPPLPARVDLPRLSQMVCRMVRDSLDAFVRKLPDQARQVRHDDDEIDRLYQGLFRELVDCMTADTAFARRALQLLLVAKNLERIADHATNIAEDVIYYLEARDVRHTLRSGGGPPAG